MEHYTISQVISQIQAGSVWVRVMFDVRAMEQNSYEEAIVTILQTAIRHRHPGCDIITISLQFPDTLSTMFMSGGRKWLIVTAPTSEEISYLPALSGRNGEFYWHMSFRPRNARREFFSFAAHVILAPKEYTSS